MNYGRHVSEGRTKANFLLFCKGHGRFRTSVIFYFSVSMGWLVVTRTEISRSFSQDGCTKTNCFLEHQGKVITSVYYCVYPNGEILCHFLWEILSSAATQL